MDRGVDNYISALLLVWNYVDLSRIQSFEIAGVKASLTDVKQKVDTLTYQVEELFKLKKIETFDEHNWANVHRVSKKGEPIKLEVTLGQAPIPGSVEVFEGVLQMPEQMYEVEDRVLRFPANTDEPINGLTIKYYPRITAAQLDKQRP